MQIFDTTVFAQIVKLLKKLNSRSREYKFVGYRINGYCLWNPEERKIFVVKNDVFTKNEENRLLEKENSSIP